MSGKSNAIRSSCFGRIVIALTYPDERGAIGRKEHTNGQRNSTQYTKIDRTLVISLYYEKSKKVVVVLNYAADESACLSLETVTTRSHRQLDLKTTDYCKVIVSSTAIGDLDGCSVV